MLKLQLRSHKVLFLSPRLPRQQKLILKLGGSNNEHHFQSPSEYYRQQYFEVLDLMNCELGRHFDQKVFKVLVELEKLIFTAVSGEEVTLQPSIMSLYAADSDFENLCAQLSMLPDIIKA